eukprot:XP_020393609.1 CASP-like protein 4A1 [Zea mays]
MLGEAADAAATSSPADLLPAPASTPVGVVADSPVEPPVASDVGMAEAPLPVVLPDLPVLGHEERAAVIAEVGDRRPATLAEERPNRGHSAKSGNKLSDRSSFSFLFSHALFFLFSARRRACCPPPRRLPVAASSARRRECSPLHAGTPPPPTQAPARLLAAAATRRAGPLGAPAPSPRPCPPRPPHPLARHAATSPHRRKV